MISSAWSTFNCLEGPDGSSRLSAAPYLSCKDDEWEISRIHAIVVLTVWGVLTPLLMGIALQTMRRQLRTAEFSRRFLLLTFGHKQGYVWWETTSMLKKFLVSGLIVLFRKHYLLQATLILLILLLFLVLTVRRVLGPDLKQNRLRAHGSGVLIQVPSRELDRAVGIADGQC